MSKDITEGILRKAGFEGGYEGRWLARKIESGNRYRFVEIYKRSRMYGRNYTVAIYSEINNCLIGAACIQTVEHFNKLMEILGIDFRLKEE